MPVAGYYSVSLHYEDGKVLVAGANEVAKAFPSVPFYDKEGNRYDLKGKVIPKQKPRDAESTKEVCAPPAQSAQGGGPVC